MLSGAGKQYGAGIIKEYSQKLTKELGKGYTFTALTRIKKFYLLITNLASLSQQLSYGHYIELLPYNDLNNVQYYIKITEEQNLSIRQLREKIKNNEYERLSKSNKEKILKKDKTDIKDIVKNPLIIKNHNNYDNILEKILQKIILEDIPSFLKELGSGFTFIANEYKIKLGINSNYIDILLFNIEYNCYVVVELKTTQLKKEHIGQVEVYMNYIDENIKKIIQNKTIGIILSKEDNKYIIKYCSDERIISREYKLI